MDARLNEFSILLVQVILVVELGSSALTDVNEKPKATHETSMIESKDNNNLFFIYLT